MLSPHDSSSSSSSNSSTSTITSASTTTTTSTQSQSQTQLQGQPLTESQALSQTQSQAQSTKRPSLLIDMLQLSPTTTTESPATSVAPAVPAILAATGDSGACTPTLPPVLSLDAESLEALFKQCLAADSFEKLNQAIGEVFSSVDRLSKSFVCPPGQEFKHLPTKPTTTTTTTTKEQLNKEQLRQLEGEHDKDEDCTQREDEPGDASDQRQDEENVQVEDDDDEDEPMASCRQQDSVEEYLEKGTKVDFCGLRRIKCLLFGAPSQTISDRLTNSVAQLADSIHYMRLYRQDLWEQVLHCLVICFDMATNSEYMAIKTAIADFNLQIYY